MPQFSVYKNSNRATQKHYPYLLDIQSNLLSDLTTTVVIPLMPKRLAGEHSMSGLNPVIKIRSETLVLMTQNLAGIDRHILRDEVCELNQYRFEILAAIDFVLSGI